jgi:hypothetical protein
MEERKLQGKYTLIPNNLIKGDSELDSKELSIIILLYTSRNSKDICTFNLEWLYNSLNIKPNNSTGKKQIREILKVLNDYEILFYYDDIFLQKEYDIKNIITTYDKHKLIFAELGEEIGDNFTMLLDKEINLLIEHSNKNNIDTYSLLKTYAYICSTFNNNKNDEDYCLGYPSIINIAERVEVTEKTALKYINILNELNIFVYDYAGFKETSKGQIKNGHMYYTRVGNEDLLLQKLNKERSQKGYIKINKINKDKSNLKRQITQKIHDIEKKQEKGQANIIDIENLKLLKEQYKELENQNKQINEKA